MQRLPFDQEMRQLKKILKQYELEFFKFHRCKPTKSDWTSCRKAQYKRYDLLKQRLSQNIEMTEIEKYEYIPRLEFKNLNQPPKRIVETRPDSVVISTPKKVVPEFKLDVEISPSCITPLKMADSAVILTPSQNNKSQNDDFIPLYSTEKRLPDISLELSPSPLKWKAMSTPTKTNSNKLPLGRNVDWDNLQTPSKSEDLENLEFEIPDEFLSTPLKMKKEQEMEDTMVKSSTDELNESTLIEDLPKTPTKSNYFDGSDGTFVSDVEENQSPCKKRKLNKINKKSRPNRVIKALAEENNENDVKIINNRQMKRVSTNYVKLKINYKRK